MDPGKKIDFLGKFSIFFRQYHKQQINFSGQISEKFRFFSGNFTKNFDFQAKICYLQLFSGQLFFSLQNSQISNILPVHDKI